MQKHGCYTTHARDQCPAQRSRTLIHLRHLPVTQRDTSLSAGPALRAQEAAEEAAAGRDRTSNAGAPASYSSSASVLFPSAPGTVPSRRRFVIWPVTVVKTFEEICKNRAKRWLGAKDNWLSRLRYKMLRHYTILGHDYVKYTTIWAFLEFIKFLKW